MLRELGSHLESRLAEVPAEFWAHRALAELAGHCRNASADWEQDVAQVKELEQLRDAAVISLAPPPGETDPAPSRPAAARDRVQEHGSALLKPRALTARVPARWRTGRAAALTVAACLILGGLAAVDVIAPRGSHASNPSAPARLATVPATSAGVPAGPGTGGPSGSSSPAATSASSSAPTRTATVTGLQVTITPATGYPEVLVSGIVTASGTGQITVTVTRAGPGASTQSTSKTESGQRSYTISHTIYLNPWCGHGPVTVTVTAGTASKSATVPVSGC